MVAQNAGTANRDLAWPVLLNRPAGKDQLRGSRGSGLAAACWIAEHLEMPVVCMWPIARFGKKQPLEKWKYLGFRTPLEIRRESRFRMRCGVGILAGKAGLVVIDIDSEESWTAFCAGREVPATLALNTHSGRQLVFRDDGVLYKTQGSQLASGVDVRGRGGLFVVYDPDQPERHFTDLTSPASVPAWLQKEIPLAGSRSRAGRSESGRGSVDMKKIIREGIPHGQHHDRLLALALSLVNQNAIDRDSWFAFACAAIRKGGEECACTDEDIYAFYDTAMEKKAQEDGVYTGDPSSLIESFADVKRKTTEWIIADYLARGEMTILDGEKASAKSFLWEDIAARLSRGETVPWSAGTGEVFRTIVFTSESSAETEIGPRLDAAGADSSVIFRHVVKPRIIRRKDADKRSKVKINGKWVERADNEHVHADDRGAYLEWVLPNHADQFAAAITAAEADIAIFDPINDFFHEDINTNSDAQIRRALAPLGIKLRESGCAAILIRHMNQSSGTQAKFRGLGASAYQNRARIHLVAAELEEGVAAEGEYGLAIIDTNLRRRKRGVRTYSIVDSDIPADNADGYVGRLEWRGHYDITADDMLNRKARGIEAYALEELVKLLRRMFDQKGSWPAAEVEKMIEQAGLSPDSTQKKKAKTRLGIRSKKVGDGWVWTNEQEKFHIKRSNGQPLSREVLPLYRYYLFFPAYRAYLVRGPRRKKRYKRYKGAHFTRARARELWYDGPNRRAKTWNSTQTRKPRWKRARPASRTGSRSRACSDMRVRARRRSCVTSSLPRGRHRIA